jgi:signal transduction histidine kinase/ActR/RegA family two-component response regulator
MSDSTPRLNDRFVARSRVFSGIASVMVMLIGAFALSGWVFGIAELKGFGGAITMKVNGGLAFIFGGLSALLLRHGERHRAAQWGGMAAAAVLGLIGAATLSQHVVGWNLGIDQVLFIEEPGAVGTMSPGRMGPPASTSFTLAGVALLLLHRRRAVTAAQLGALVVGFIALFAGTGYAYGVEWLYGVARITGIAVHTSVALLLLSASILFAYPDRGVAALIASDAIGGVMARRLLLFALAGPLLLGWILLRLQDLRYFDTRFGVALLVLALTAILFAVTAQTAVQVNRAEGRRVAAESRVRDRLHEIEKMMEALPIAVFIASDRSGETIVGNRAAREFFRMAEGEPNLSLSAPGAQERIRVRTYSEGVEIAAQELPVQRAAREGVAVHDMELDAVFDDGTLRHGLVTALPLLDEREGPRGAVASLMDITPWKIARQEREELLTRERDARSEAEAANRAKDEFLATVSHELRTPLNAILGWATMLRDHTVKDEALVERALATIERSCRTQAQLIEDLLDVSRIVAGKLLLDTKPVDLVSVIKAAADSVRPAADMKQVQLRITADPAASQVTGDSTRLQQVIWNLLSNAVKFSSNGGLIEVTLRTEDDSAVVEVSDSGEGIEPDFLPFVFERFRQADGAKTRRFTGLGLGLSIARSIAEMHGGTIEATSAGRGRGSRFTVRFPPMRTRSAAAVAQAPSPPATTTTTRSSLHGLRILAVDDEADIRTMVRTLLEQHGADVMAVASPQEALDAVSGWKPDLLVSDIGMPGPDGYDLIRRLRELERGQTRHTPAIALTTHVSIDERLRALTAGYQMFVPKPVEPSELIAIIEDLTGRASVGTT